MRDEVLQWKKNECSRLLEAAMMDEKTFDEAIALAISHQQHQVKDIKRMALVLKNKMADELAKNIQAYANTFQGIGWNKNMLLALGQCSSGMLGLGKSMQLSFEAKKGCEEMIKNVSTLTQIAQQTFGTVKGLTDEGNQLNKMMAQHTLENTKKRQEENKANLQRLQQSTAELQNQAKTLEEARHRAKMSSMGG